MSEERGIDGGSGGMGPGERGKGGDESEDLALRDDDADQVKGGGMGGGMGPGGGAEPGGGMGGGMGPGEPGAGEEGDRSGQG